MSKYGREISVKYEIQKYNDTYKLVSISETNFGGPAVNYVMSGTLDECREIKERLEKMNG